MMASKPSHRMMKRASRPEIPINARKSDAPCSSDYSRRVSLPRAAQLCIMGRMLSLLYGLLVSAFSAVSFLYLIGFTGNLLVPKSIDSGLPEPIGRALPIDLLLVSIFAVQHSVMARQGFKKWWTRMVPAPVERSTYVLLASIVTGLLFWQWRPVPVVVWNVENPAGRALLILMFCLGWVLLLLATMLIAPLDLLGLRQIY